MELCDISCRGTTLCYTVSTKVDDTKVSTKGDDTKVSTKEDDVIVHNSPSTALN